MNTLLIARRAAILTITLNRVEKKNALIPSMYQGLVAALRQAQADATIWAVVLQGHETVFSAGNDMADFLSRTSSNQDSPAMDFLRAISGFTKPLVAAVCGPAVGIGTTLLLHCDLVYAGDNAVFSMPFVNLGLCPEAASSYLAPLRMGYARAAQALLLGEPFGAQTALAMGLVNHIAAPNEVAALAQRQAQTLAGKPLAALIETKRLMRKSHACAVAEHLQDEHASFQRLLQTPAAKEACSAFLEKRKPDFSGL
jgi:enoyl-CoA hydratase/carnithine racemase